MNILVINCGSSSLKFDLLTMPEGVELASGHVERIGAVTALGTFQVGDEKSIRQSFDAGDHAISSSRICAIIRTSKAMEMWKPLAIVWYTAGSNSPSRF